MKSKLILTLKIAGKSWTWQWGSLIGGVEIASAKIVILTIGIELGWLVGEAK